MRERQAKNRRLIRLVSALILVVSACYGGIGEEVEPGESMAKLCEAAQALADATGLAGGAIASIDAGDLVTGADRARQADVRRQDGMALASWSAQLEDRLDSPVSPGFDDRIDEVRAARQAVDLLVGALGEPAAPVTAEARPRLLAAARDAVGRIALPATCTAIDVPTPAP